MLHRGFPGKPHLSVGASLAARFQTKIKNVFTTEITETMEESDCFNSVISVTSVVKLALLLLWEVQLAGRMLLQTRACCQNLRSAS